MNIAETMVTGLQQVLDDNPGFEFPIVAVASCGAAVVSEDNTDELTFGIVCVRFTGTGKGEATKLFQSPDVPCQWLAPISVSYSNAEVGFVVKEELNIEQPN